MHVAVLPRWILLLVLGTLGMACSPRVVEQAPTRLSPTVANTAVPGTFSDPFAYCAAVGTRDAPDARYTGPQVPDAIINGFKKAAGLEASTEPLEILRKTTIWRCMDGQVYACNFGANLPCDSKANTDRTPSQAIKDFCSATPNADVVPMSVTGHDTIYSWHCVSGAPEILDQIAKPDAAGYLSQIWYATAPNP